MHDDYRVTSEPYRLMPPRKRTGSDLGEAPAAARVNRSELREALVAARRAAPAPAEDNGIPWRVASVSRQRQWPRHLGRVLTRVDVWILIVGIIGVVIAYLAWVKPH
jgi:hypothetical protein